MDVTSSIGNVPAKDISEVALPLPETVILPIANGGLCLTPSSESRITLKAAGQSD
jgi:hypothetical protein